MPNKYYSEIDQSSPPPSAKSMGGRDGGKHLSDRETEPPYNANIGPGGPDLNRVGFPMVKSHMKSKMSPTLGADGGLPTLPAVDINAMPLPLASTTPVGGSLPIRQGR